MARSVLSQSRELEFENRNEIAMTSSRPAPAIPPAPPSASRASLEAGFVAEAVLDGLVRSGEVVRTDALLTTREGRRFVARDAIRVLGRSNGETDPYGLTGRVDTVRDFLRKGAIVSGNALRIGPAIYDIEYGALVHPMASADDSGVNPRVLPG